MLEAHLVHEFGDDEEAAAAAGQEVWFGMGVEGLDVEALTVVADLAVQLIALEAQRDLHLFGGAAVTDGVGAGFFEAEHDVVDETSSAQLTRR